MPSEKFDFKSASGQTLSGRLEKSEGQAKGTAIFAHCFTCSKNILAASRISRGLASAGFNVLRFDFTGIGNSEGDFSNAHFSGNVSDLICAHRALREQGHNPGLLIGHSLGGAAVLRAALELSDIRAVCTIGAPSDVEHVTHLFQDHLDEIDHKGEATVKLGRRDFKINQNFVDDLRSHKLIDSLKELRKSVLIMHSPTDQTVSIDHAAELYQGLKHPKSFIGLDGIDHLVSSAQDADYIALVINAWVSRY